MARVKRPSNHPDVIQERCIAAAAAASAAAVSPPPYRTTEPPPPRSPLRVRPSTSASPSAFRYTSRTPPRRETTPPISPSGTAASHSTLFEAPRLVDLEATEASDEDLSAPVDPGFDLDTGRALNIYRVATQRANRRANPPRRRPLVYRCEPCARSFPSYRQRRSHEAGLPHRRAVAVAEYPTGKLTCHVCDRRFGNGHYAEQHYSGTIHHRAIRKVRRTRRSD